MKVRSTSKSVYFLMEVMIVILLFAISSTVCIQVHAQAVTIQKEANATRFSMQQATTILEGIKTGVYPVQCHKKRDCTWEVVSDAQVYTFSLAGIDKEQGMLIIQQEEQELLKLPFTYIAEVME